MIQLPVESHCSEIRLVLCETGTRAQMLRLPFTYYLSLLDESEQLRAERFRLARDRTNFIVSRGVLRVALSAVADILPADRRFLPDAYGRPRIANALPPICHLDFNISHCDGLVAVAVRIGGCGPEGPIGVDVERVKDFDVLAIARRFFAESEFVWLSGLAPSRRARGFFALWTLKESYAKATGRGLSLDFRRIEFDVTNQPKIQMMSLPPDGRPFAPLRFLHWHLNECHTIALCCSEADKVSIVEHAPGQVAVSGCGPAKLDPTFLALGPALPRMCGDPDSFLQLIRKYDSSMFEVVNHYCSVTSDL